MGEPACAELFTLIENASDIVYVHDLTGRFTYANKAIQQILGYKQHEIPGLTLETLVAPDCLELAYEQLRRRVSGERAMVPFVLTANARDGRPVKLEVSTQVLYRDGTPHSIQGIARDISARTKAEQARAASESERKRVLEELAVQKAYFEQLFEGAPEAVVIEDNSGFVQMANREFGRLFGYDPQTIVGKPLDELISLPDRRLEANALTRHVAAGGRFSIETVRSRSDGTLVDVAIVGTPIQVDSGQLAVYVMYRDITQRKRAEQMQAALYEIANQTQNAADLQAFYRAIHSIVGKLVYAKNFYIALYDQESDLLSFPYFVDEQDPAPPPPRALRRSLTAYVLHTGQPLLAHPEKFDELVKAGEVELVGAESIDWLGVPLKTGDKTFGVLASQSYTHAHRFGQLEHDILTFVSRHVASAIQHKADEERLLELEARYRSLFERAGYGIFRTTVDGKILDVNPAMVSMLGYQSADEVKQLGLITDLYTDAAERDRIQREYRLDGHTDNLEARWKRKDGKNIVVRLTKRAFRGRSGKLEGYEVMVEDITERRALEEQLRHAQKMEAVGRLAGGVAHDFNNLLTVIKGYSELMLDHFAAGDPIRSQVEEIRKASDRAATLTRQLLAFSRRQVLAPKVLDLNAAILNMDKLLKRLLGEDIELRCSLAGDIGRVKADPGQVEQVLMNLAVNARDAMPSGGKLTIETANVYLDETVWKHEARIEPGEYVMIAVTDTGCGMDEETRTQIFEPFFTTKERGTGLGLSTVYGIVKQSGGYVWVYSELGRGTAFKIYLPRISDEAENHGSRDVDRKVLRGSETILLVEDEDGVRALVRQMLERDGYKVIETHSGDEAIATCERNGIKIDLLLTDVVLKQMSGAELASRLGEMRPGLRVLFISGYTHDAIVRHGVLREGIAFLQKPFTAHALASKVREVLDNR